MMERLSYEQCCQLRDAGYKPGFLDCAVWMVWHGENHGWKYAANPLMGMPRDEWFRLGGGRVEGLTSFPAELRPIACPNCDEIMAAMAEVCPDKQFALWQPDCGGWLAGERELARCKTLPVDTPYGATPAAAAHKLYLALARAAAAQEPRDG